jgi:NADH-quinone oxidoreductase subunit E
MSVRRLDPVQPESFKFTRQNLSWAKGQLKKYPSDKQASAIIPLLWKAQEQHDGWLPEPAIRHVADMLGMPYIRALEVATFYTMFNLSPVGEFFVQLCGTTPCMLCGSGDLIDVCKRVIGPEHTVTEDGKLSWMEVECLGACVNSPMAQINKDYFEDLTPEVFEQILADLVAGKNVKPGPQNGRHASEPLSGLTSLTDPTLYNGKGRGAKAAAKPKRTSAPAKTKAVSASSAGKQAAPKLMKAPRKGGADRLTMISGVGPKIEGTLHKLGIFHFDQVAAWKRAEVAWVDDQLKFKGRIDRENWIKQAKALAKGGEAEYIKVFGKKPR